MATAWEALAGGAAGAVTVTLLNEAAKRAFPAEAPRADVLGMRAIAQGAQAVGVEPPRGNALFGTALAGDLVANTLYYALTGAGESEGALTRGALLGAAAGVGAVALPPVIGLGARPTARTPTTAVLTVAWYVAGGLAAAVVVRLLSSARR
jgi:hypothetical protein